MEERSPVQVAVLGFVTIGIYAILWYFRTRDELNERGASVPTEWWRLFVPIINILWVWEYSKSVDQVTKGKVPAVNAILFLAFLGPIGQAILQASYNELDLGVAPATS